MNLKKENDQKNKTWQWWVEKVIIPILIALLSGYFLLLSSNIIKNPFQSQVLPTATVIPTSQLKGFWSGAGTISIPTKENYMDIDVGVEIHAPCKANVVCGKIYIYTIVCSYSLIYINEKEGRYYFQQGDYEGTCGNAELIYFEPLPNGDLLFHSEGNNGTFEAMLIKN